MDVCDRLYNRVEVENLFFLGNGISQSPPELDTPLQGNLWLILGRFHLSDLLIERELALNNIIDQLHHSCIVELDIGTHAQVSIVGRLLNHSRVDGGDDAPRHPIALARLMIDLLDTGRLEDSISKGKCHVGGTGDGTRHD
jgi:hypothetical protein